MVWVVKRAHRRYGVFVACPRKVTIAGHPILYHFAEPKKKKTHMQLLENLIILSIMNTS